MRMSVYVLVSKFGVTAVFTSLKISGVIYSEEVYLQGVIRYYAMHATRLEKIYVGAHPGYRGCIFQ